MRAPAASGLKRLALYALAYLLWLLVVAACIVAVVQFRSAMNVLWPALGGNSYSLGLVNQVTLLLGGLLAFGYVVLLESSLREAVARGLGQDSGLARLSPEAMRNPLTPWLRSYGCDLLLWRFGQAIGVPLVVIVLSFVLLEIGLRALV